MADDDKTYDGKQFTADRLRAMLFDTINGVKNKTITVDQAKAISDTAQSIVNITKVELDWARVHKQQLPSNFLPQTKLVGNGEPEEK